MEAPAQSSTKDELVRLRRIKWLRVRFEKMLLETVINSESSETAYIEGKEDDWFDFRVYHSDNQRFDERYQLGVIVRELDIDAVRQELNSIVKPINEFKGTLLLWLINPEDESVRYGFVKMSDSVHPPTTYYKIELKVLGQVGLADILGYHKAMVKLIDLVQRNDSYSAYPFGTERTSQFLLAS